MDTKATARRSAKYYKREISTIPKQDKAQHQHTMEEEHSIEISIIFRPRLREIHSQNGLIHQNLIIIKVDQSTDHQEIGLPPQVEISIPETAADRENDMTTLLAVPTGAEITGNAAVFLAIPRTTGKIPLEFSSSGAGETAITRHFSGNTRRQWASKLRLP